VGSNFEAISAAKKEAESLGYNTLVLSSMIEGETKHVAHVHSAIAREIIKTGNPLPAPACILSGGETTVTITGSGLGGRCQEFALAAALDISGNENIVILRMLQAQWQIPTRSTAPRQRDWIPASTSQTMTRITFSKKWRICLSPDPPTPT
jgi:hypothetical protein